MMRPAKQEGNLERRYLKRRLEHLRVQKARFGSHTDPEILMEIEDIEEELENFRVEENAALHQLLRKKINPTELVKARKKYLENLEKDVNNRLQTSIHNARFIDIGSEKSLDSTFIPGIYQGEGVLEEFTRFEEVFERFEQRVLLLGGQVQERRPR